MPRSSAAWQRRRKTALRARRLLALAAIYDGAMRTEAAKIGGVGLQIIRDWVICVQRARPGWAPGWKIVGPVDGGGKVGHGAPA